MSENKMTRAEREEAMAAALAVAQSKVQRYNEITQAAWDGEEYDAKELVAVQGDIDEACAEFNHHAKILTYLDCKVEAEAFGRYVSEIAAEKLRYRVIGTKDNKVAAPCGGCLPISGKGKSPPPLVGCCSLRVEGQKPGRRSKAKNFY